MINRRTLMQRIGSSALAALAISGTALPLRETVAADPGRLVPEDEEAEQLLYELARLEARYYTEEGTAMVLACENLAEPAIAAFEPTGLNRRFTAGFRHYSELLAGLRTDLTEQDAASVIELLAYRDLANAGSQGE